MVRLDRLRTNSICQWFATRCNRAIEGNKPGEPRLPLRPVSRDAVEGARPSAWPATEADRDACEGGDEGGQGS